MPFNWVIYGPEVAIVGLLDDALVDEVAKLGFNLAGVDSLLLRRRQLLLHLSEPGHLGSNVIHFFFFVLLICLDLLLGAPAHARLLHEGTTDTTGNYELKY